MWLTEISSYKMTTTATQIFNFLRGAVRSAFGIEDFRGKRIVVVGMDIIGQELLSMLCFDDVKLFFFDNKLVNYSDAHIVCSSVNVLAEEESNIDIVINLDEGYLIIDGNFETKDFQLIDINEDPYNQGIHEFYL